MTELLTALTVETDASVRRAIINSLHAFKDLQFVAALIPLLADEAASVQNDAIGSLVAIGDLAIPALETALTSDDKQFRFNAAKALFELKTDAAPSYLKLAAMDDTNADIQLTAIQILLDYNRELYLPLVKRQIDSKHDQVRQHIARELVDDQFKDLTIGGATYSFIPIDDIDTTAHTLCVVYRDGKIYFYEKY